jgi:DNA modification methylase
VRDLRHLAVCSHMPRSARGRKPWTSKQYWRGTLAQHRIGLVDRNLEATLTTENVLYYGDNLDILRRYVKDESVDLVYLDPPFNSDATYNVLFAEHSGERAAAQIRAFEDTWRWDQAAARAYQEAVENGGRVADALRAFFVFLGGSDMMAYLAIMAPRLAELRRVLTQAGSIYLHCDPTASHYLKMLMDAIFGPDKFRNEIIWKRSHGHNSAKRFGVAHDTILFYSRSASPTWQPVFHTYDPDYVLKHYRHADAHGRLYKHENPTGAGTRRGITGQPWRGIDPTPKGRHWAKTHDEMDRLDAEGLIHWPDKGGWPYIKVYLDERLGSPAQDVWTDIDVINMMAQERLGYPTQKPVALLERIIQASSKIGDTVLDPFCGCGTAIVAAQKLERRWIGIDITHLAIGLIRHRLTSSFGTEVKYGVIGEPADLASATELAETDPYQFQWWALGLCGARPAEQKKGADKGIDGRLYFHDESSGGSTKQIIFSVKAGHTGSAHVRDLLGVLDREKAQIGVLISLQEPTRDMRKEAASAGFYASPWGQNYPRVQLLTIEALLSGASVDYPPSQANVTLKKAPRVQPPKLKTGALPFIAGEQDDE